MGASGSWDEVADGDSLAKQSSGTNAEALIVLGKARVYEDRAIDAASTWWGLSSLPGGQTREGTSLAIDSLTNQLGAGGAYPDQDCAQWGQARNLLFAARSDAGADPGTTGGDAGAVGAVEQGQADRDANIEKLKQDLLDNAKKAVEIGSGAIIAIAAVAFVLLYFKGKP